MKMWKLDTRYSIMIVWSLFYLELLRVICLLRKNNCYPSLGASIIPQGTFGSDSAFLLILHFLFVTNFSAYT